MAKANKSDLLLFLGLLAVIFILLEVVPSQIGAFSYLVYQELGLLIPHLMFDFMIAAILSAGISAVVIYKKLGGDTMEKLGDNQPNAMMKFFGKARDKYGALGLQKEAKECELAIALVSRIYLDPRLEEGTVSKNKT